MQLCRPRPRPHGCEGVSRGPTASRTAAAGAWVSVAVSTPLPPRWLKTPTVTLARESAVRAGLGGPERPALAWFTHGAAAWLGFLQAWRLPADGRFPRITWKRLEVEDHHFHSIKAALSPVLTPREGL